MRKKKPTFHKCCTPIQWRHLASDGAQCAACGARNGRHIRSHLRPREMTHARAQLAVHDTPWSAMAQAARNVEIEREQPYSGAVARGGDAYTWCGRLALEDVLEVRLLEVHYLHICTAGGGALIQRDYPKGVQIGKAWERRVRPQKVRWSYACGGCARARRCSSRALPSSGYAYPPIPGSSRSSPSPSCSSRCWYSGS